METQTIVLGHVSSPGTGITFNKVLEHGQTFKKSCTSPTEWDFLELVANKGDYDIIFAYDTNQRNRGCLYLGHWNSGHV